MYDIDNNNFRYRPCLVCYNKYLYKTYYTMSVTATLHTNSQFEWKTSQILSYFW